MLWVLSPIKGDSEHGKHLFVESGPAVPHGTPVIKPNEYVQMAHPMQEDFGGIDDVCPFFLRTMEGASGFVSVLGVEHAWVLFMLLPFGFCFCRRR